MGMSFGDWLDYWFENFSKPTLRSSTQSSYTHWIKDHLVPDLGRIPIGKLTQADLQRFLIQAKAEGLYELFLLELTTGMRRGELLALRWDDLDFTTGELRITKQVYPVGEKLVFDEPKTKAGKRTNILLPSILNVLAE